MATGGAVCIGMNEVDAGQYGSSFRLPGCEADARAMADLLRGPTYQRPVVLASALAAQESVAAAINTARLATRAGDLFVLSYSGHGIQVESLTGEEIDGMDECWCLHDHPVIDNEIREWLRPFPVDSRVLVISDSCHSGTILSVRTALTMRGMDGGGLPPIKELPKETVAYLYRRDPRFYDSRLQAAVVPLKALDASVLLMSACHDSQTKRSGLTNSQYTTAGLAALKKSPPSYTAVAARAAAPRPADRTPEFDVSGVTSIKGSPPFPEQLPFAV